MDRQPRLRGMHMSDIFHRQLASYAQYHRDPHNCATHFVGIPMLFLAVILPLQAFPVHIGRHEVPLAIVLSLPAIVGWLWLDLRLGAALLLLLCPLFIAAALIVRHGHVLTWCSAAVLFVVGWAFQLVGHAVFECRRPAFVDDVSYALIGPMFVVAKLLVSLGLRADLAPHLGEPRHEAVQQRVFDWVK
jgi:uncharacterized membrane protein YGL010W